MTDYYQFPYDFDNQKSLEVADIYVVSIDNLKNETLPLPGKFSTFGFIHCIKGKGTMILNGQQINLEKGLILLIHPDDMMSKLELSEKSEFFLIYISQSYMLKIDPRLLDFGYIISDKVYQTILNTQESQNLQRFEQKLMYEFVNELPYKDLILKVYITELLIKIERKLQNISNSEVSHPLVKNFFVLLAENQGYRQTVTWYARKLKISTKHLNDIIKSETEKTVKTIINDKTLLEAKNYLANSNLSIQDISYKLNFSSHVYFSAFFKQLTHETPLEYRNKMKEN